MLGAANAGVKLIGASVLLALLPAAASAEASGEDAFTWPGLVDAAARGLEARDPGARLAALELLVDGDDPSVRALLRATLRDPDRTMRLCAARILAARQDDPGLATITEWLGDGSATERAAALEALRLAPRLPPSTRAAVEGTFRDADSAVKLAALALLEREPGPSATRIAFLLEDPRPSVRSTAARLLGRAGDRRTTVALIDRLSDVDPEVQRQAIRALGRLGDPGAGPALLTLIGHGPEELRDTTIDALGRLRLSAAVPTLSALARRRPADVEGRQAVRALGEIGTPAAIRSLILELERGPLHPDLEEALARHPRAVAPWLDEALAAEDGRAPVAARLAGLLRQAQAAPALRALLRVRGPAALPALEALVALGARDAVPEMVEIASEGPSVLRRAALDGLLRLADPRAHAALAAALTDPDPHLRLRALELAQLIGVGDAGPEVHRALSDRVPAVAAAAVRTVETASLSGAAAALVAVLPRLPGREGAVGRALRRVARPADLPVLLAALPGAGPDARLALLDGLVGALIAAGERRSPARTAALQLLRRQREPVGPAAELAAEGLSAGEPAAARTERRQVLALASLALAEAQAPANRVAAAWDLAGSREPAARAALRQLAASSHPALAQTARAALETSQPPGDVLRLRLMGPAAPVANRWLTVRWPGGGPVWTRTGSLGQAWLAVPARSVLQVRLVDGEVALQHAGDGLGQLAGDDVPAAQQARGIGPRFTVRVDAQRRRLRHRQPLGQQARQHAGQHVTAAGGPQ
jgi:HEAT repeat protein